MKRRGFWVLNAMLAGSICAAEDALPHDPAEALEIEPPVLIQSRAADGTLVVNGAGTLTGPELELTQLEKDLNRAKRNADGGERLYRSGIIAKVDAEARTLKVVQLEAKLAEARLAEAKRKAGSGPNSASADLAIETTDLVVMQAAAIAQRAAEERKRAELEAALRNLQRQQKLLALGSGRKADVKRAEQKLAELQPSGQN
ncbi:MAG: hypothetical protein H0T95_09280 [Chthoniobacterales bacterium]|nr:hypothetical protein [Chthoniobacterales bacterium]